ncbi:MAG: Na+/H+ antiporter subunit E [Planctomycetota bacterium]
MISRFMLNLFLAVVYVMLSGGVTVLSLTTGFVIGMLIVTLLGRAGVLGPRQGSRSYLGRIWGLVRFGGYFLYVLVKTNLQVAWEILTPGFSMSPRIIRYPVDGLSDVQTTTLANAITLTPGTLSADISDDGCVLYVHCMYAADRAEAVAGLDEMRRWLMREIFDTDPKGRREGAGDVG